ncbi:MAG: heme-binding protein [Bacteroidota bacterium]|jgi:uncharacterized protein GlcG (DUF336 family)
MKQLMIAAVLMALVCISFFSIPASAQLATKKVMTLDAAKKLASAAEAEALKNKWTMVIAIADDGGNLMYLEKIDNTQIGSIEVAIQKAKTAILFKRPTKVFEDKVIKEGRTAILSLPNAIAIEGGLPIVVDGQYIGAIGISGGSSDQDGVVAKAAVDKFSAQ